MPHGSQLGTDAAVDELVPHAQDESPDDLRIHILMHDRVALQSFADSLANRFQLLIAELFGDGRVYFYFPLLLIE